MTTQSTIDQELAEIKATLNDGCPSWASEMISTITVLEVEAGTIKNPTEQTSTNGWSTAQLDDLAKVAGRMDDQGRQELADEVETLFGKVSRGLTAEGHNPDAIAAMINARVPTGCRLPYCSAAEVRDALS